MVASLFSANMRLRAAGGFDPTQLKLAGTGLRWPGGFSTVSGNNYKAQDFAVGMPDVEVEEVYFFFPTFYMTTSDEVDAPNGYTIEGMATRASNGTRTLGLIDGGTDPIVLNPAVPATQYGKWVRFTPASPIPAGVTQVFTVAMFIPDGATPLPRTMQTQASLTNVFGQTMPVERFQGSTTSLLSTLSNNTAYLNQNGPRPPIPSMMMVRGVQTAYIGLGDSIQFGSAQATGAVFYTSRMAFGYTEMAMDDDQNSRRIPGNNLAIPGWNFTDTLTAGSHANATAAARQLWAVQKAMELNDGRPIADILVTNHGQNSANENVTTLVRSARSLAALWRTALGNEDLPIWWTGMVASPISTDGWQTVGNQSPRESTSIWPTGSRWTFNEAHESPTGELRVDGTVQVSVPLWPVSSADSTDNRDVFAVRPFTATLTSAYSGTGNLFMSAAPPLGAWLGFIDGTTIHSGQQVTAVTGTGPYEVSIGIPGGAAISSGAIVQERWVDGSGTFTAPTQPLNGVHPSTAAHVLYAQPIIAAKVAQGFVRPTTAPVLSGVSISGAAEDSETLTANYTVTGFPTPSVSIEWEDGAGATIGTGNTITLNAGAMGLVNGETITLRIAATNSAGSDEKTASITFSATSSALVMPSPVAYFVAPANVPSGTTRLTFRGKFKLPSIVNNMLLFSQESNGCDFQIPLNGSVVVNVEDTAGTRVVNGVTVAPAGTITTGSELDIVFDVNHATQQVSITINGGTPFTQAFSTPGTGSFQSNREVSFLANTSGAQAVPTGTEFRDLSVDYNGTLHKAISNSAATANADAWKQGSGSFTNV